MKTQHPVLGTYSTRDVDGGVLHCQKLQTHTGEDGIQDDLVVETPDYAELEAIRSFWLTGGMDMVRSIARWVKEDSINEWDEDGVINEGKVQVKVLERIAREEFAQHPEIVESYKGNMEALVCRFVASWSAEGLADMNRRELINLMWEGVKPVDRRSANEQLCARYDDLEFVSNEALAEKQADITTVIIDEFREYCSNG